MTLQVNIFTQHHHMLGVFHCLQVCLYCLSFIYSYFALKAIKKKKSIVFAHTHVRYFSFFLVQGLNTQQEGGKWGSWYLYTISDYLVICFYYFWTTWIICNTLNDQPGAQELHRDDRNDAFILKVTLTERVLPLKSFTLQQLRSTGVAGELPGEALVQETSHVPVTTSLC